MRYARLVTAMVSFTMAACMDEQGLTENTLGPDKPRANHMETQLEPHEDVDWSTYMATGGGTADATDPLWSGQLFGTAADSPSDAYCPMGVPFPEYQVRLTNGTVVTFQMAGTAIYMHDVPSPNPSYRAARYSLPPGAHSVSIDGIYEAWNGTLYGVCRVWRKQILGKIVEGGFVDWFKFDGEVWTRDNPDSGGNGGGRGWAYSKDGTQNGDGTSGTINDWQTALNNYLTTGTCTQGWEVWVDGVQVCSAT